MSFTPSDARRDELLGSSLGKWVLIHGWELVGAFESRADADQRRIHSGLGTSRSLVKQVVPVEVPQNYVSNHLGDLGAARLVHGRAGAQPGGDRTDRRDPDRGPCSSRSDPRLERAAGAEPRRDGGNDRHGEPPGP